MLDYKEMAYRVQRNKKDGVSYGGIENDRHGSFENSNFGIQKIQKSSKSSNHHDDHPSPAVIKWMTKGHQ
jgi:hypothetical protein